MHLQMAWADRSPDCLRRLSSDADFFHLRTAHPVLNPPALARHGLEDKNGEPSPCRKAGLDISRSWRDVSVE